MHSILFDTCLRLHFLSHNCETRRKNFIDFTKEFDTRRHRKRLQLQSRQLYFRCKQKLLKSQLRGRSWPILYIIVFLGVVWITVLVFCHFKQKNAKNSPIFLHKSSYFSLLIHFWKGFAQQTQIDKVMTKSPVIFWDLQI